MEKIRIVLEFPIPLGRLIEHLTHLKDNLVGDDAVVMAVKSGSHGGIAIDAEVDPPAERPH